MKEKIFESEIKNKSRLIIVLISASIAFTIVCFGLNIFSKANSTKIPVKVTKFVDGDTIKVKILDDDFPVRLVGVDCFESSKNQRSYRQAYENNISIEKVVENGISSKEFMQKLYNDSNKNVYLDFIGIDKYGRALGYIWFDDKNVNQLLIKNGGCMVYEYKKEQNQK